MLNDYNFLSTKCGFNISLKHFKVVNSFIDKCSKYNNLADLINESINDDVLQKYQIKAILNVLLTDKFNYCTKSINLNSIYNGPLEDLSKIFTGWNLFDIVIVYYHPQLGITVINPKNEESWKVISGELIKNELVVIYTGFFGKEYDKEKAYQVCDAVAEIIQGSDIKKINHESFGSKEYVFTKPEKKQQVITQPHNISIQRKLSGQLGILVTNELFHNGNVEAWKKIIESYETKFPDTKILVFYDNEEIKDINTLFKWGKVKSGSFIYIRLFGPEFRFFSKLKRYLYQGASHNFEAFLKGAPGNVLSLF